MCKYCIDSVNDNGNIRAKDMDNKKLKFGIFRSTMQLKINSEKEIVCHLWNFDNGDEGVSVSKPINYCPMCGQKL